MKEQDTTEHGEDYESMSEEQWRTHVLRSFAKGSARMDSMDEQIQANTTEIKANTAITLRVEKNTGEVLEVFSAVKGGFRVLEWIGKGAKWLAAISAAGLVLWKVFTGKWPG